MPTQQTNHHYDRKSREHLSSTRMAADEGLLAPAFSTTLALPATIPAGKVAVLNDAGDAWLLVEDFRGEVFDTVNGVKSIHTELGALPEGLTHLPPGELESWDGSAWAFDSAKAIAAHTAALERAYHTAIAAITSAYPASERETWSIQEAEARAWTADNSVATPFISALATARGLTVADLAPSIIIKADAFKALSAELIGKRKKLLDALAQLDPASKTIEADIAAITFNQV